MNKSASVEIVRSSTIRQGSQEESHLPVSWGIGKKTSVWAVELAGTCELDLTPLSHGQGAHTPTDERAFVEV